MHPRDFNVGATWLAFRINQRPISTSDGQHDVFVLQDAGSMFIFGTAFAEHDAEAPPEVDAEALLRRGWEHRNEWPRELVLVGRPSSENAFIRAAATIGVPVRTVPEASLSLYIKDVQEAFEEYFFGEGGP